MQHCLHQKRQYDDGVELDADGYVTHIAKEVLEEKDLQGGQDVHPSSTNLGTTPACLTAGSAAGGEHRRFLAQA